MTREIKNDLYRINHACGTFVLVECDSVDELFMWCAKHVVRGHIISGVVKLSSESKTTPRVRVLSDPAFKRAVKTEQGRIDDSERGV